MEETPKPTCDRLSCACGTKPQPLPQRGDWQRRQFIKTLGLGAAALAASPWRAMAGPFTRADFEKLVPVDKKLRPEWVKSLTERGERTVYHGADLDQIGMPVGGICAGQVYLGGDGRLWHWDIFNRRIATGAAHYANPMKVAAPFEQGFAIRVTSKRGSFTRSLAKGEWTDIAFTGEYPIGYVQYQDPAFPASVRLEAFSPFIPLNTEDSSFPATVMQFTVHNRSAEAIEVELGGWLENAVCLHSAANRDGLRCNRIRKRKNLLYLECSAEDVPGDATAARPDVLFDDFERNDYGSWTPSGTAFGNAPAELSRVPAYQGELDAKGSRVVNSHASAPGDTVEARDNAIGTLTSRPFQVERNYITFLIGGGSHQGRTCMNLLVEDQVVRTATGQDNNRMQPCSWDTRRWLGKTAKLQIVDQQAGGWGNIGIDEIVFTDKPVKSTGALSSEEDFGSLCLALVDPKRSDRGDAAVPGASAGPVFPRPSGRADFVNKRFDDRLTGAVSRKLKLAAGGDATVTFILTWYLPNLRLQRLPEGRYYGNRFESAVAVATHLGSNLERLGRETRLWHDTWYDSSLPYWFLDRTFLNTSILASSTCYRLSTGRFYAWEGVGCCEGTCGHVWQYAHAVARLFPDLERRTRELVDFGSAMQPDGAIHFRGEFNDIPAIDAQAGTILRALREHRGSTDSRFLQRNWPRIRKATEWLIAKDADGDGLIEGNQHNTLDTDWFGPVTWLSGLYHAALLAAETMASETGDREFAVVCRKIFETGRQKIVRELFDGEYFINKPDPKHLDAINSGTGCHIDQVFGQSWAFQVGLPRVFPERETRTALESLWRYNFTPDVGPYRDHYKAGRWYAMPGEAGLLMCTFPRSDWDYAQAKGKGADWAAGYFNECMNGFEYQVAGHMLWENMVMQGMAITRAVHDRYHASRRNPWNEVECGDHYARSMASYGIFLAACGFEYDGPNGMIGFAPRIHPEQFKCPFTAAEGWGGFHQATVGGSYTSGLQMKWGTLTLKTLRLAPGVSLSGTSIRVRLDGKSVNATHVSEGPSLEIRFAKEIRLGAGHTLTVELS